MVRYVVYDKKKKKALEETYFKERYAKESILYTISGAVLGEKNLNRAIYYLDNFVVKRIEIPNTKSKTKKATTTTTRKRVIAKKK